MGQNEMIEQLCAALCSLTTSEEAHALLSDLCTTREINELAQRLEVARDLAQGASYQKTIEKTGASSATIGRVKRCLDYGAGGYRLILDRLDGEEKG